MTQLRPGQCNARGPYDTICTDYPGHRYSHYDAGDDSSFQDGWRQDHADADDPMRVLTVKDPWAHSIIHLGKDVENRSWTTKYRGWVAVHVGLQLDKVAPAPEKYQHSPGTIIGVVWLQDVITDSKSKWAEPDQYHWVLRDAAPLVVPIEHKGGLGLRKIDPTPLWGWLE